MCEIRYSFWTVTVKRMIADDEFGRIHERNRDPCALLGGEVCELRYGVGVVAVPTECDDEFRRCRLDHPTIVGKWRAAEALGPLAGDPLRTVRNSDDVASKIPQDAQIRRVVA